MKTFVALCISCCVGALALSGCSSKSTTGSTGDGGSEGGAGGSSAAAADATCIEAKHKSGCSSDQLSASEMTSALASCKQVFQLGCGSEYAGVLDCLGAAKCGADGKTDATSCATKLQAVQTCVTSKADAGGGGGGGGDASIPPDPEG